MGGDTRTRWARRIEIAANVSVICIAIALLWYMLRPSPQRATRPTTPLPSEPLTVAGAHRYGPPTARVGLLVFSDFECPACQQFARTVLPALKTQYVESGRLMIAFRHMPIEAIHPLALGAAKAAQCAAEQDRFWQVHDFLFNNPTALRPQDVSARSIELGLTPSLFDTCVSKPLDAQILADLALGKKLQLSGTPTVFAGPMITQRGEAHVSPTIVISGTRTVAAYAATIDKVYATLDK